MKNKEVVIERGNGQIPPSLNRKKYPFMEMNIGDNFLIECSPDMILKTRQRIIGSANSIIKHYGVDRKFSTRTEDKGVRVYRIK